MIERVHRFYALNVALLPKKPNFSPVGLNASSWLGLDERVIDVIGGKSLHLLLRHIQGAERRSRAAV